MISTYLAAEAGDTLYHDRGSGEPGFRIENPSVSLAVMPQPDVLAKLGRLRAARERGLLARFLIAYAESRIGQRDIDPPVLDATVQERYRHNVRTLLQWMHELREETPVQLVLEPAAQAVLGSFRRETEVQLGEGSQLGDAELRWWGSKLAGRVVKIASHIHMMEHLERLPAHVSLHEFGERLSEEITRRTLEGAISIGRYIIPHQVQAFESMLGGAALADAKRLAAWWERTERTEFSGRDARYAFPKTIQQSLECNSRLAQALSLLLAMGRIELKEEQPAKHPQGGRTHSLVYVVVQQPQAEGAQG
jgi:hypothetical protein